MPKFLEGKLMFIFIVLVLGSIVIFGEEDTKKDHQCVGDGQEIYLKN